MDFFAEQRAARARTRKLVFLLLVALLFLTIALYAVALPILGWTSGSFQLQPPFDEPRYEIWDPKLFLMLLGLLSTAVSGAALYKYSQLAEGGAVVARNLGGRLVVHGTTSPAERKLLNVVEEMALASGISVPAVYILDEDAGINAFAAGFSPNEAVIGVTLGTVERLTRDELQGVIAHEFSHILNGDMRLNIRLIALIHGLIFISLIGEFIFRSVTRRNRSRSKGGGKEVAAVVAFGLALWLLGLLGVLCSRLIKSSIARQREFLADASAVQFTRNPAGIAGALKKILYGANGDKILSPRREEVSHFLFSNSVSGFFSGLMATHPPLPERIKRIDPSFISTDAERLAFLERGAPSEDHEQVGVMQFSSETTPRGYDSSSAAIVDSIGNVSERSVDFARGTMHGLPPVIKGMLRDADSAQAIILALVISSEPEIKLRQFDYLHRKGADRTVIEILPTVAHLSPETRLPIVQLAVGVLGEMAKPEAQKFLITVRDLCGIDDHISFFEFALLIVVRTTLQRKFNITAAPRAKYFKLDEVRGHVSLVFSRLAEAGTGDPQQQELAFSRAVEGLANYAKLPQAPLELVAISEALDHLRATAIDVKQDIVKRMSTLVLSDSCVTIEEGELFRAVCATLDVPVPPWCG